MYLQLFLFSFLITITVLLILTLLSVQYSAEEQYTSCTSDSECNEDNGGKCVNKNCAYVSD